MMKPDISAVRGVVVVVVVAVVYILSSPLCVLYLDLPSRFIPHNNI